MASMANDILIEILDEDLPKLADLYKDKKESIPHAYNHIRMGMEWRQKGYTDYIKFFSPNNCWTEDGTFISIAQFSCFNVAAFSLDESGKNIYEGLSKTEKIKYDNTIPVQFFALPAIFNEALEKTIALKKLTVLKRVSAWAMYFKKELEKEKQLSIPSDIYIRKLDKSDARIMNDLWPQKHPDSDKYIEKLLEINGGYGICLKSTDELVSWGLITLFGQIGILQTKENHKRKGYGELVTLYVAKEMAKRGYDTYATILAGFPVTANLFGKLGFIRAGYTGYIYVTAN